MSASGNVNVAILSDIHYAAAAERARGNDYELRAIKNPMVRTAARLYRHLFWMRNPLDHAPQLERFLAEVGQVDYVVANGDYSCDSGFVGVSDDAAAESVKECLGKLRTRFGERAHFVFGDHELGKLTLAGGVGGMRLESWRRATGELGLQPFWQAGIGNWLLMGVASPLIALPANQPDALPQEWAEWLRLREEHLAAIRAAFDVLRPEQRVILFCHDPTALSFLWREAAVNRRLPQIAQTVIGHLHTQLIFWNSRVLSGMPAIRFLGHSVRRMSSALHEARHWRPFHPRLCPSLSGIELLNDGGYFTMEIEPAAQRPPRFVFHPLPR